MVIKIKDDDTLLRVPPVSDQRFCYLVYSAFPCSTTEMIVFFPKD